MSLSYTVPSSLEYFACLVQSDEHFPLLEAAASLAQDEYIDLDVQQLLGDVDQLLARLQRLARGVDQAPRGHQQWRRGHRQHRRDRQ